MKQTLYAAVFTVVLTLPVCAQDWNIKRHIYEGAKWNCEWLGACQQFYKMRNWRHRHDSVRREYDRYQTYDWRPRSSGAVQRGAMCSPFGDITALSARTHKIEDEAIKDAWIQWMAAVAYDGGGQVYMDPENSTRRRAHCAQVEIGQGFRGGLSRAGGKLLNSVAPGGDKTSDGRSVKCRIWATPCRTGPEVAESPQQAIETRREEREERRDQRRHR